MHPNKAIKINDTENQAIEALYKLIKDPLKVKKFILFGSRVRGEAGKYSDIDLLVLTEKPRTLDDRNQLADFSAEVNVDYGVAMSCLYYNEKDWETGKAINPLLKDNVEREGIELNENQNNHC